MTCRGGLEKPLFFCEIYTKLHEEEPSGEISGEAKFLDKKTKRRPKIYRCVIFQDSEIGQGCSEAECRPSEALDGAK